MRYFIGNWKMYGSPNSIKIIHKINSFVNSDNNNNKKYRTIIATPYTLLESFNKTFLNKKTQIAAQNCFHKDYYSSNTGAVSAYMIKQLGIDKDFCQANAIKYLCRYGKKNGHNRKDLLKAIHYIVLLMSGEDQEYVDQIEEDALKTNNKEDTNE